MRHHGIRSAIPRIDLRDPLQPAVRGTIGQQRRGCLDGHRIERIRGEAQRCTGLLGGLLHIRVFQRQIGQQFVRFYQVRIELQRLTQIDRRFVVEASRAHQRQSQVRLRVFRVALQGFLE